MKIGHGLDAGSLAPLANGAAADAKAPAAVPAPGASPAEASAKVALSDTVQSLRQDDGTPAFDADKVARISQAIADGTFKVNADVIADKLIANAQEVLAKVTR